MIFSCGYILKPPCTRLENFDPYNTNMLEGVRPVTVNLTVSVFGFIFLYFLNIYASKLLINELLYIDSENSVLIHRYYWRKSKLN